MYYTFILYGLAALFLFYTWLNWAVYPKTRPLREQKVMGGSSNIVAQPYYYVTTLLMSQLYYTNIITRGRTDRTNAVLRLFTQVTQQTHSQQ